VKFWEIGVEPANARDGRYESIPGTALTVEKILWGRVPSSEHIIEIDEVIVRVIARSPIFEGTEVREERPILLEPKTAGMEVRIAPSWDGSSFHPTPVNMEVKASLQEVDIVVPAGTWREVLEVTTDIKPDEANKWTIISYYVQGVGLVKEVQFDPEGSESYRLELESFETKNADHP